MPNFVIFEERGVIAKGVSRNNTIDVIKYRSYFHDEDYQNLSLLDNISLEGLPSKVPRLFYPGCGADILFPLHYVEKLFPAVKEVDFFFVDCVDNFQMVKTVLDDIGVTFSEEEKNLQFYWKQTLIRLTFQQGDALSLIRSLPPFDIYFEKAFRIMREQDLFYEQQVLEKLLIGGYVISDSGFQGMNLEKVDIPQELSSYQEMIIGRKVQ